VLGTEVAGEVGVERRRTARVGGPASGPDRRRRSAALFRSGRLPGRRSAAGRGSVGPGPGCCVAASAHSLTGALPAHADAHRPSRGAAVGGDV